MTDASKVAEAIDIIAECRQVHVDYAEWQETTPGWRDQCTPDENTGGPEFHRLWVAKYDTVLDVLVSRQRGGDA